MTVQVDNPVQNLKAQKSAHKAHLSKIAGTFALNSKAAARILGLSAKTLANWRVKGAGPAFVKSPGQRGAVRYTLKSLQTWQASHLRSSTSSEGI
jgi:hypothetical protein